MKLALITMLLPADVEITKPPEAVMVSHVFDEDHDDEQMLDDLLEASATVIKRMTRRGGFGENGKKHGSAAT